MSELKPCPFCGGQAEWLMIPDGKKFITCSNVECLGPTTSSMMDKVKVSREWNTRAPDTDGRIEGLSSELDEAVRLLWSYGAKDYVTRNYPNVAAVLEVSDQIASDPDWQQVTK